MFDCDTVAIRPREVYTQLGHFGEYSSELFLDNCTHRLFAASMQSSAFRCLLVVRSQGSLPRALRHMLLGPW